MCCRSISVTTRVVNIKVTPVFDVYVGRRGHGHDGYFGNPVIRGQHCQLCGTTHWDDGSTLPCFERWARRRVSADPTWRTKVASLRGKVLGCFCAPGPCHGDVLARLAEEWSEPVQVVEAP